MSKLATNLEVEDPCIPSLDYSYVFIDTIWGLNLLACIPEQESKLLQLLDQGVCLEGDNQATIRKSQVSEAKSLLLANELLPWAEYILVCANETRESKLRRLDSFAAGFGVIKTIVDRRIRVILA